MTDRRDDFEGEKRQTQDISPELANSEQDDELGQAQTVAGESLGDVTSEEFGLDDTEKVSTGEDGDDVQDIVDHMRQMVSSGRIDNSAYAGEPNDDDNDDRYRPSVEPENPASANGDE